jgi:hypothetical protein
LVPPQDVPQAGRDLAALGAALDEFARDLEAHIARPTPGGIEGDDADWIYVLAVEQVADDSRTVRLFVGLAPGAADAAAEIVQHKIDIPVRFVRYD